MKSGKIPVVLSADIYHELSDFDQLDLMILLARPEFEIKGIILDQMRTEWGKGKPHSPDYLRSILKLVGREDIPVMSGVSKSLTDVDGDAERLKHYAAIQFLHQTMAENPGLIVFNWASVADITVAYQTAPVSCRKHLSTTYGNLGWFKRALYPEPIETGLQSECNVMYDPMAFLEALQSDMPFVWFPCNEGAWMLDFARYFQNKSGWIAKWLTRELYHYHIIRELKSIPRGGRDRYFMTMREEMFDSANPEPVRELGTAVTELELMERDDLATRPIRMYQTGSTYHAACVASGLPHPGIRMTDYQFDVSDCYGAPYFDHYREADCGIPVLHGQDPVAMERFMDESLRCFASEFFCDLSQEAVV